MYRISIFKIRPQLGLGLEENYYTYSTMYAKKQNITLHVHQLESIN